MGTLLAFGPTIITFVIVFAILVLAHEFGHFITARLMGMDVEEFGFGFPPKLFGKKFGKTVYSINLIPLGGFVRIKGEDDPETTGPDTFAGKSLAARTLVVTAGVIMNLLLASVLFSVGFMIGLPQLTEDLPSYARISDQRVQVLEVLPDYPADEAGLYAGDVIVSLDSKPFGEVSDIQAYVDGKGNSALVVEVRRGEETFEKTMTPRLLEESGKHVMGVALVESAIVSYPWHIAIGKGFTSTVYYVKEIFVAFGTVIGGIFIKGGESVEVSGPIGIAVITGRVAKLGFAYLMQFTALLSVNLAVINILPIPALDGGRLLFLLIERVRGKGVRPFIEATIHRMAFMLLLLLIIIITIQDIERYRESILGALKSLFGVS